MLLKEQYSKCLVNSFFSLDDCTLVMEYSGILYCLNSYSSKNEMLLFNRYVWDKLRPSNGYFEQNMAKKLKVFFK